MNKQFVLSVVVVFVVAMLVGMVVHGMMLHGDYDKLAGTVFRTPADSQQHFIYIIAAHLSMAIGLTWVYRQGRTAAPWMGQGVRFGIALWVLITIPTYLIYFAVQPLPSDMVAKQVFLDGIGNLVIGLATAFMNRGGASAPMRA
jgi:hypothetical protein